jgi:hypothetical protein
VAQIFHIFQNTCQTHLIAPLFFSVLLVLILSFNQKG